MQIKEYKNAVSRQIYTTVGDFIHCLTCHAQKPRATHKQRIITFSEY